MTELLAYFGDEKLKARTLDTMRAHREADEIVQGRYWSDGKGCAVGCMTNNPNGGHEEYPKLWGIPEKLAYLEDTLFESLRVEDSKDWPVRFLDAIPVGADLSRAWNRWQAWCLRDLVPVAGENGGVVAAMAALFERASVGDEPSVTEWYNAGRAAGAAWDAWAARAAGAAGAASAARAAGAAWAAWDGRAAWAAWAAWDAEAAGAAWAAWDGRAAWARRACDALVEILSSSPVEGAKE